MMGASVGKKMKAVILAAGKGERLSQGEGKSKLPKPLIPLLWLSLIERTILSAKESGKINPRQCTHLT